MHSNISHSHALTFLIWSNLCDLVYQLTTRNYRTQIPVAFCTPSHVTTCLHTKHLPDVPCKVLVGVEKWESILHQVRQSDLSTVTCVEGLELSFWSAVFITSVGHISELPSAKRLTGLCGMSVGAGEIIGLCICVCRFTMVKSDVPYPMRSVGGVLISLP